MLEKSFVINKNVKDLQGKTFMERAFNRITKNLKAVFFFGNSFCSGTVMNLSEKGMYIKSEIFLPINSILDVYIPLKEKVLKLPVKINRIKKSGDCYNAMAVVFLSPNKNYLKFVENLRSVSSIIS